jgi:hypothetical protein
MPARKRFRVGRASAELGLFATAPIEKGELIVEYTGRRITTAESNRREARGARYMYEINSRWAVDGSRRKNTRANANHSTARTPNPTDQGQGHAAGDRADQAAARSPTIMVANISTDHQAQGLQMRALRRAQGPRREELRVVPPRSVMPRECGAPSKP